MNHLIVSQANSTQPYHVQHACIDLLSHNNLTLVDVLPIMAPTATRQLIEVQDQFLQSLLCDPSQIWSFFNKVIWIREQDTTHPHQNPIYGTTLIIWSQLSEMTL